MRRIEIKLLGNVEKILDSYLEPLMYLAAGTFKEAPQRTHWWNNIKLRREDVEDLDRTSMVAYKGVSGTMSRVPILFHIPILGGWRGYVVMEPFNYPYEWHFGWIACDTVGVSQLKVKGAVRALLGPGPVKFFGVSEKGDFQLFLKHVGTGRIGEGGPYKYLPLL